MRLRNLLATFCHLTYATVHTAYYDALGVAPSASAREIKKAFKKLVLQLHPDKNQNDPEADAKFMEMNKIYEVLKDEDSRKRYDLFGEESGSAKKASTKTSFEDVMRGFSAYDDCEECAILDGADFEAAMRAAKVANKVWFVVFKSGMCQACNNMAIAFADAARAMKGIVNFGVVDCNKYNRLVATTLVDRNGRIDIY